jgi:hypothetical protein
MYVDMKDLYIVIQFKMRIYFASYPIFWYALRIYQKKLSAHFYDIRYLSSRRVKMKTRMITREVDRTTK